MNGAPGRIRTCDQRISSPPLYPTELRGHIRPQVQRSLRNVRTDQRGRIID